MNDLASKYSKEVLSRYNPERGDRILYIMTEVAEQWLIDIEGINDYVTPSLLELLTKECITTHLIPDTPESEKTYELF